MTERKKYSRLDIYRDLLTVSHGAYARRLPYGGAREWRRRLSGAIRYAGKTIRDGWRHRGQALIGDRTSAPGKIWLLIASKNNYEALRFLHNRLPDTVFIALYKKTLDLGAFPRLNLSRQGRYWLQAPFLWLRLYPVYGSMLWRKPDELLMASGAYEAARYILQKGRPRALLFANDHIPEMRAFLWAARDLGIPTIYIQHASVSELFPPLRFDLNLLEGKDSLEKYRRCGPVEGKVELIGMPKFDHFLSFRNYSDKVQRVGICSNLLDEESRVLELLHTLRHRVPEIELSFRPHPRDVRTWALPPGVAVSDSTRESIFDYLRHQDLIIAGDTSTHLEAVLLNVTSIYYSMNDYLSDYYGYVRQGLVEAPPDLKALVQLVGRYRNHRPSVLHRARPYNAVVGTPKDGRSSDLAVAAITSFLEREPRKQTSADES